MSMSPKCVNVCVCNTCLQHTMIQCPKTHKSPFKMTLLALHYCSGDTCTQLFVLGPHVQRRCCKSDHFSSSVCLCQRSQAASQQLRVLETERGRRRRQTAALFLNTWWEYKHPQMRALIMARQFCYASLGVKPLWGTSAGCCDISGVYVLLRKWTKRRIASQGGAAWCGRGI